MQKIYLQVPFKEKDQAKSLGARFDWDAKLWYVNQGTDLNKFVRWLGEDLIANLDLTIQPNTAISNQDGFGLTRGNSTSGANTSITDVSSEKAGITLSQLLGNIASAVHSVYSQGVWTIVEIIEIHARGHIYLDLSERDENNRQLAKARAMIWQSTANKILPEFEAATGATIGAGIKLLVLAVPQFHPQYGFSLQIEAIDAKFTLGYLEAKRREIRARLQNEGVYDSNRSLLPPWDFNSVLVVAPHQAAGLGDFQQEATRLQTHGICNFNYAYSRFQGEGAAREIATALEKALDDLSSNPPDVIVIIRGGGSVSDLAWLDDYDLSRTICDLNIPVFTGIGHQRDNTIVDEVAHTKFDTPSKVIAGIEHRIMQRVSEVKGFVQAIYDIAIQDIHNAKTACSQIDNIIAQAKYNYQFAATKVDTEFKQIVGLVNGNKNQAKKDLDDIFKWVVKLTRDSKNNARKESTQAINYILELAHINKEQGQKSLSSDLKYLIEQIYDQVKLADSNAQSLIREIIGQGPDKTLNRGFAIIRDADNKTITSSKSAVTAKKLKIEFKDGEVPVNIN